MAGEYYILNNNDEPIPVDAHTWSEWFTKNRDRKRIARDEIDGGGDNGGVTVSTVFLGLDHGWGDGPPILFETMIFGGPHDQDQDRYATRAEALAGHARMLAIATEPQTETRAEE